MNLDLITFYSSLHSKIELDKDREPLYKRLSSVFNLNIIEAYQYINVYNNSKDNASKCSLKVIFIASGGTEEMFLNLFPVLKEPFIILADSYHNSLAAAFEICSWLDQQDIKHQLITVPFNLDDNFTETLVHYFSSYNKNESLKDKLKNYKIGSIGGYSNWLIASHININSIIQRCMVVYEEINIDELTNIFNRQKNDRKEIALDPLVLKYKAFLLNVSQDSLEDSIIMYYAIKELCEIHKLNAITIKCFDLIKTCKTTACLALAILNDNGIISGCEGDMATLFSLIWLNICTGQLGFMANPSSIDKDNLSIDLAHCTIPLSLTSSFKLPSHFESKLGLGIQGEMPLGKYTLFKIGGHNLDNIIVCKGQLIECQHINNRCRTQIRFKFDSEASFIKFIDNRLGNHVVIAKGELEF